MFTFVTININIYIYISEYIVCIRCIVSNITARLNIHLIRFLRLWDHPKGVATAWALKGPHFGRRREAHVVILVGANDQLIRAFLPNLACGHSISCTGDLHFFRSPSLACCHWSWSFENRERVQHIAALGRLHLVPKCHHGLGLQHLKLHLNGRGWVVWSPCDFLLLLAGFAVQFPFPIEEWRDWHRLNRPVLQQDLHFWFGDFPDRACHISSCGLHPLLEALWSQNFFHILQSSRCRVLVLSQTCWTFWAISLRQLWASGSWWIWPLIWQCWNCSPCLPRQLSHAFLGSIAHGFICAFLSVQQDGNQMDLQVSQVTLHGKLLPVISAQFLGNVLPLGCDVDQGDRVLQEIFVAQGFLCLNRQACANMFMPYVWANLANNIYI